VRATAPMLASPAMIPSELLGSVRTPEGSDMTLLRRGNEFVILADGKALMSNRMHGSEEALATLGCDRARTLEEPCVLVGGLGMGFSLRAALDLLPAGATVVVAELLPAIVAWNEGVLGPLAGNPLRDRRVRVELGDVGRTLREAQGRFDAVLLDVDNGPSAFTQSANGQLYGDAGVATARRALRDGGVYAVWSARDDMRFQHRMRHNGFSVEAHRVRARLKRGGPVHTIFVGRL
jgi:spermidine synthase